MKKNKKRSCDRNIIKNPLKYKKYNINEKEKKTTCFTSCTIWWKECMSYFQTKKESIDRILQHFTYLINFERKQKNELNQELEAKKEMYEQIQKEEDYNSEPNSL